MQGLAQAERRFDRQLPSDYEALEFTEPFCEANVGDFIKGLAAADDPLVWLEDHGIGESYRRQVIDAELLQVLCQQWGKDPLKVHDAAGTTFWKVMRAMALESRDNH
ncbi:MAG TPA: hypothetical protein VIT92_11930 [Burkholderiaceae bacterium]